LAAPQINETVLVIGLGLLGLLTIQITRSGCRVLGMIFLSTVNLAQDLGCDACLRDEIDSVALPFTKGRDLIMY
jgi:threonine dehydrogenase-like Zn-dependent dehydrogenase